MVFKNFRFNVFLRALFLILSALFVAFAFLETSWFFGKIVSTCLFAISIFEVIRYLEGTNRSLVKFLSAVKYEDFTTSYLELDKGETFKELGVALNQIIKNFQEVRAEKESHYQYLQLLNDHVSVALICFSPDGKIHLINPAAKELLEKSSISNISETSTVSLKLPPLLNSIASGERELVKVTIGSQLKILAIHAREFKLLNRRLKLISIQDIRNELEENEIVAWQKLIRVLTHEIMNSVTPIISLTNAVNKLMSDRDGSPKKLGDLEEEEGMDIFNSIQTIGNRSKGLLNFVNAYKDYAQILQPVFSEVSVEQLIKEVVQLVKHQLQIQNINLSLSILQTFTLKIDVNLIQQVLINLIQNACDALKTQALAEIRLEAFVSGELYFISVADNGPGITEEVADKIFIPFFTTKKTGIGIGLSLSRQIMSAHKGAIFFESKVGEGSKFILQF